MSTYDSNLPAPVSNTGVQMSELGSFEFHGDLITVVTTEAGNWAVLSQLCQNLTLDTEGQRQAIGRKSWSKGRTCITQVQLPGDNQSRPQFLIHERIVPMWLANITSSRIKDETIQRRIEIAQVELADALYDYVARRHPGRAEPTKLELAKDLVAALEAREAMEAMNKVLAPMASKWQRFMNAEGLIGMTELADIIGTNVRKMTEWLVELGIFRKQTSAQGGNRNMPRTTFQSSKHFEVKIEEKNGFKFPTAYATSEGVDLIVENWERRAA